MRYVLGIDGGGTKTAALILDAEEQERGRGQSGPGNIATGDDSTLRRTLREAAHSACAAAGLPTHTRFAAVCAGVAGYSVVERREAFQAMLREEIAADHYRVEPDYVIAHWGAACGEPGIVIIAGTGAVSYGRNADGQDCKEDGLGYLLGDQGSGFDLGLRALRHTLTRMQAGETDRLSEAVLKHTAARAQHEVMQWLYGNFSPARVAGLAPVVGRLAEEGDPVSRRQLVEIARRLRHAVRQVRHKLWLPRETPVYMLGGLWQLGEFLRSEFACPQWQGDEDQTIEPEALQGGRFEVREPKSDPAGGAALLALRSMGNVSPASL